MKKYYNQTTQEWYAEGEKVTRKISNGVFIGAPSEEQLTEWGFAEYIEPVLTPEQLLENAKQEKLMEITAYDKSSNVNSFSINNTRMWLTVAERQQLATQISACESIGRTYMTRWFGGNEFTFTIEQWKQMLIALEVYAGDALNVTEFHKAAVKALESIEDVEAYDYTVGYPNKLEI